MFEYQLMERARDDQQAHRAAREHRRPDPRGGRDPAAPRRRRPDPARRRERWSGPAPRPSALDLDGGDRRLPHRSGAAWSASPPSTPTARAHKGMTIERAREVVTDVSYFGTMMVHLGLADGMVSGAVNTTAHTIRPALEFVKTKPGVNTVSSVFLMCLADRVLVYGDCAVDPRPDHRAARRHRHLLGRDRRRSSASSRGWRCCPTRPARPGPAPTWRRCVRRRRWWPNAHRICRWRVRSSTTPRSTWTSPGPSCRTPRWPAGRPCSSSRT